MFKHLRRIAVALAALPSLAAAQSSGNYVVIAANDLGMHCMQNDYSQFMLLPPYNTLRAIVIRRGGEPSIAGSNVTVNFEIPGNTHSTDKTNFWNYAPQLFGVPLAPDMGLKGFSLSGAMRRDSARRDFVAEGIPVTPMDDDGTENAYSLATVTVKSGNSVVAKTQAVVPVSWEISCNLCHTSEGETVGTNILKAHDRIHGTHLMQQQPVMCASCHSDNALGAPGNPGIESLSGAMHTGHASRMGAVNLTNECYACHPGIRTTCQRDVHAARGMDCKTCHTSMAAVGSASRRPWIDLPRCDSCHNVPGHDYEQTGTLYRNSVGHSGVACYACHGSPHAIGPAMTQADNAQATRLQGHSGVINTCTVCHTSTPGESFFHRRGD